MNEAITAALIGAFASSLQQISGGLFKMARALFTGFFVAYYAGEDVANFAQTYFNFEISKGGTIFLVAFFGSEILEKLILIARSAQIGIKWGG